MQKKSWQAQKKVSTENEVVLPTPKPYGWVMEALQLGAKTEDIMHLAKLQPDQRRQAIRKVRKEGKTAWGSHDKNNTNKA